MPSQQQLLRGRGASASQALLLSQGDDGESSSMPQWATPLMDEQLRQEVEFFQQWGFLVVEDA
jgi:hypothetical protein